MGRAETTFIIFVSCGVRGFVRCCSVHRGGDKCGVGTYVFAKVGYCLLMVLLSRKVIGDGLSGVVLAIGTVQWLSCDGVKKGSECTVVVW